MKKKSDRGEERKLIRVEMEEDHSEENEAKCPGYKYIRRFSEVYQKEIEVLVPCNERHDWTEAFDGHRESIQVRHYSDLTKERVRVRSYDFKPNATQRPPKPRRTDFISAKESGVVFRKRLP